jgi:hypothetical protein
MLSISGIYEDGQIRLLEPIPFLKRAKVIVTILEETEMVKEDPETDVDLFDDLVGAVGGHEDGSEMHDQYLGKTI